MTPFIFEPSWILLTHNRVEIVKKCFYHNLGEEIDLKEIIWIDNGTDEDDLKNIGLIRQMSILKILNHENQGVARGYNQGYVLATGSHVVITGCDRLMPIGWLQMFQTCFQHIPNTGIISIYSKTREQVPERFLSEKRFIVTEEILMGSQVMHPHGIVIEECIPFEARILSRELFNKIGYLREDFGLYGYEDIEWSNRAQRVTKELGLINYTIPGMVAEHIGTEGVVDYDGKDDQEYHEFKKRELLDPKKLEVFNQCVKDQFPYYNPFL